ncbi:MAG: DUF4388 domain-containing protein [Pseudomonadota bacterium]
MRSDAGVAAGIRGGVSGEIGRIGGRPGIIRGPLVHQEPEASAGSSGAHAASSPATHTSSAQVVTPGNNPGEVASAASPSRLSQARAEGVALGGGVEPAALGFVEGVDSLPGGVVAGDVAANEEAAGTARVAVARTEVGREAGIESGVARRYEAGIEPDGERQVDMGNVTGVETGMDRGIEMALDARIDAIVSSAFAQIEDAVGQILDAVPDESFAKTEERVDDELADEDTIDDPDEPEIERIVEVDAEEPPDEPEMSAEVDRSGAGDQSDEGERADEKVSPADRESPDQDGGSRDLSWELDDDDDDDLGPAIAGALDEQLLVPPDRASEKAEAVSESPRGSAGSSAGSSVEVKIETEAKTGTEAGAPAEEERDREKQIGKRADIERYIETELGAEWETKGMTGEGADSDADVEIEIEGGAEIPAAVDAAAAVEQETQAWAKTVGVAETNATKESTSRLGAEIKAWAERQEREFERAPAPAPVEARESAETGREDGGEVVVTEEAIVAEETSGTESCPGKTSQSVTLRAEEDDYEIEVVGSESEHDAGSEEQNVDAIGASSRIDADELWGLPGDVFDEAATTTPMEPSERKDSWIAGSDHDDLARQIELWSSSTMDQGGGENLESSFAPPTGGSGQSSTSPQQGFDFELQSGNIVLDDGEREVTIEVVDGEGKSETGTGTGTGTGTEAEAEAGETDEIVFPRILTHEDEEDEADEWGVGRGSSTEETRVISDSVVSPSTPGASFSSGAPGSQCQPSNVAQSEQAFVAAGARASAAADESCTVDTAASAATAASVSPAVAAASSGIPAVAVSAEVSGGASAGIFARASAAAAPAVGWQGSLASEDMAALITRLHRERFRGRVCFRRDGAEKAVFFEDGRPVFATSSLPYDRMGDLLYREGKITREQYAKSRDVMTDTGRRMGEILVEMGFLKKRELAQAVRRHLEDIIYSLFAWESGDYEASPGDWAQNERIRLSAHPVALAHEGIRRKLGIERLRAKIGPATATIEPFGSDEIAEAVARIDLLARERQVIDLSNGHNTIAEVVAAVHLDETAVYQLAYWLVALKLARVVDKGSPMSITKITSSGDSSEAQPQWIAGDLTIDRARILAKYAQVTEGDYFAVLGVRRDATSFEVRRAYEAARYDYAEESFSPDIRSELEGEIREIGFVLEEAHRVLRDDRVRAAYLQNLKD